MNIKEYEIAMWETAKNRDAAGFKEYVCEDAVMVCGGYRCSGAEYAGYIADYDVEEYEFVNFEVVLDTDDICQVHYVIRTKAKEEKNKDLEGIFHVTSTWKRFDGKWKIVFNMDSRIIE